MTTMTVRQILAAVRAMGLKARMVGDEFRITVKGEAEAYYTEDGADALATARAMAGLRPILKLKRPIPRDIAFSARTVAALHNVNRQLRTWRYNDTRNGPNAWWIQDGRVY